MCQCAECSLSRCEECCLATRTRGKDLLYFSIKVQFDIISVIKSFLACGWTIAYHVIK